MSKIAAAPRFVYVHGNQTSHWSNAWAGWLEAQLSKAGYETFFETMPDSIVARANYWLPFLKDHVGVGPNDVLIGWSSGAVAAMRYAETNQLHSSILISPYYTDLGDPEEAQSGYFNDPWQWKTIAANQQHIASFYSANDPYIPQLEFERIAKKLQAQQHRLDAGGHFMEQQKFPELLAYIVAMYPLAESKTLK